MTHLEAWGEALNERRFHLFVLSCCSLLIRLLAEAPK